MCYKAKLQDQTVMNSSWYIDQTNKWIIQTSTNSSRRPSVWLQNNPCCLIRHRDNLKCTNTHTKSINQSINHKYSLFSGCSFISEYSRAEVNRLIWDEFTCQQTAVLRFSSSPEECDPLRTGAETFCSSVSFTFQFSNSHMLFRVWRVWKIQVSKNTCE